MRRAKAIELRRFAVWLLVSGWACDAPTAAEVFLNYADDVRAAQLVATMDEEPARDLELPDLPAGGFATAVLVLPDRFGGRTLTLSMQGLTEDGAIAARWSGSVVLATGEVVRVSASLHPECGDAIERAPETCDDGNIDGGDGCSAVCAIEPPPPGCGDGRIESPELCDDGANARGDGCSPVCRLEDGWVCRGAPSRCDPMSPSCGNGALEAPELCDDGGGASNDGCSAACAIEQGWTCTGAPSSCTRVDPGPSVCFGVPMRCELASGLVLVDGSGPSCPAGPGQGTFGDPFCTLATAIASRAGGTIVLASGEYQGEIEIKDQALVIASSGDAAIVSGGAQVLRIGTGGSVTLEGIAIRGGGLKVETGRLNLIASTVGPSPGIGVEVKDSEVTVERSRILDNAKGGISLDGGLHRIVSSVLADNGSDESQLGGLRISKTAASSLFANDTIVGNRSKDDRTAGVRCSSAAEILSSIVWDNDGGAELGVDSACVPHHSDLARPYEGPGVGNISADPSFADADHHLAEGSPCLDAGDSALATDLDIDGDPRRLGAGVDIGADELR